VFACFLPTGRVMGSRAVWRVPHSTRLFAVCINKVNGPREAEAARQIADVVMKQGT